CEDCFGEPIVLVHEAPIYVPHSERGHLYVVSRKALDAAKIGSIDLADRVKSNFTVRFVNQRAWIIGSLNTGVPEDCLVAHVEADAGVWRSVAEQGGFRTTTDLFPSRKEDILLRLLLSAPWTRVPNLPALDLPTYRRRLMIPEYDFERIERRPQSEAYVEP